MAYIGHDKKLASKLKSITVSRRVLSFEAGPIDGRRHEWEAYHWKGT